MQLVEFKKNVRSLHEKGELPLPPNVSPEAFQAAAIVAYTDNPQIARCTPESIFKSLRKLAGMGLVPDGMEAALAPFNTKVKGADGRERWENVCQAMPMVAGLIKRARNSGEVKSLWADVVYEGETVEVWIEDGDRKWNHVRADGSRINPMDRGGEIIGAYAVAKLADGGVDFEPLAKQEIEKIRAVSKSANGPAWRNWYSEMAKKSAIRRLCKRLPISAADRRVIIADDDVDLMKDVTPRPAVQSLQERLLEQTEPPIIEGAPEEEGEAEDAAEPGPAHDPEAEKRALAEFEQARQQELAEFK